MGSGGGFRGWVQGVGSGGGLSGWVQGVGSWGGLGGWVGGDICVCLKGKWVYIQQNKWFEF